jgi:hypothetical protein
MRMPRLFHGGRKFRSLKEGEEAHEEKCRDASRRRRWSFALGSYRRRSGAVAWVWGERSNRRGEQSLRGRQ